MSAITAKASRIMKKYAVLTREPRCFLGSFDFSWEQRKLGDIGKARSGVGFPDADQGGVTGVPFFKVSDMNLDGNENEMIVANNYVTAEQIADHRWSPITELPAIFFAKVGAAVMLNRKRLCRFPFLLDNNTMAYSLSPTKWDADFAKALFGTVDLTSLVQVGALPSYNAGDVESMGIYLPSLFEQEQIGAFFKLLDNLITLHQRKCANLCSPSQVVFSLLFATSTFSWEQRKFSELVQIERGGSPRPIDDFITDAPNGLNWIKIGDAPTQGNYITKTAEKIRPEGLSKTREVHPGDLILSNSMSFGKPYIMGIDGCIHDGWLLIRNTYGVFDLTFLCHLLGTPQMLSQYRSLAAGSTVNNLNKELVGNTVVTIPSITEQRVLGDYLEQLDNLITLHQRECISFTGRADRLILTANKKRTTSSWEQRKAKEICSIGTGKSNTQDQVDDGKYPFYIRSDVPVRSNKYLYDCEAVITIGDGNIGKVFHYVNGKFDLHQRCYKMTDFKDIWGKYFFYYFSTKFYDRAMKMTAKATVDSVRLEMISEMDIKKPPQISEQKQIAEFFANLDNLITLHQRKPFLMKWRTSDANRNQTNRLVL